MSKITLTNKGQKTMLRLKARYNDLKPEYGRNTFDRVVFENGKVPASMICYAIGNPTQDDMDDMVRQGYAKRA